jgi:hypothetical protein
MTPLSRSLASGAAGALALTALHELVRRRVTHAPRMDVIAMRGLRRVLPERHYEPDHLHRAALAGDLLANSVYYSAVAAPTAGETWMRAAALGAAAGLCALVLPERLGLGPPPHSEHRANQLMTVGWYIIGAAAAGIAATLIGHDQPETQAD